MTLDMNKILADLCEAHDLIEGYEDIRNDEKGTQWPNDAMLARQLLAQAIWELRKKVEKSA